MQVNKTLNIQNYEGSGSVGEKLSLQGKFEKVEWPEISIFLNGLITLNSSYTRVELNELSLKVIDADTDGILVLNGTETKFSGRITIAEPLGRFVFERINSTTRLYVDGAAHSINIPSAGINVK